MKILRIYNTATGDFIRDDFTYDHGTESAYDGDIPGGLYQPWFVRSLDGTGEWLEGLTPAQIQALKDSAVPGEPSIEERVITIEDTIELMFGG